MVRFETCNKAILVLLLHDHVLIMAMQVHLMIVLSQVVSPHGSLRRFVQTVPTLLVSQPDGLCCDLAEAPCVDQLHFAGTHAPPVDGVCVH